MTTPQDQDNELLTPAEIQQAILSQAAGRAYPNLFRTLGEVIKK